MRLYIGTSGYSYKEWKGSFYPERLPARAMLQHYAAHFNAVEINNTFYRMPTPALLSGWAAQVPASFRFALKAPQRITHVQRLRDSAETLEYFLETVAVLADRLGPMLFQLPPGFRADAALLAEFLALLPPGRAAFEFRHPSWLNDAIFDLLRKHGSALCIAETEEDTTPFVATADWGYLRLRRPDYDDAALRVWMDRLATTPWTAAYVFFKHEDTAQGPAFAARLRGLTGG